MTIYTGIADANGDFTVPFSSAYTGGEKITVTAEGGGAKKSIELYAPTEVTGGVISFTGTYNDFPANVGEMHFSGEITNISPYAFYQSGAGGITLRTSVTALKFEQVNTIGEYAFHAYRSCKSIDFGNTLINIGDYCFQGCSELLNIDFGNSLQSIGIDSFFGCAKLTSINLPNTVTSLRDNAFSGCSGVININISTGLTSLPNSVFRNCKPAQLTIPAGIVSMGNRALGGMTTLTQLTMLPTAPPTITANTLDLLPAGCVINIAAASLSAYQSAPNWSEYASQMVGV